MQVFVNRSDLTGAVDERVNVIATYTDGIVINPTMHGTAATLLSLPTAAIAGANQMPYLVQNWRTINPNQEITFEANVRINAVFPDYSQRNANNEMNGYITAYGTNTGSWPAAAQSRNAEMNRCWTYVNQVRAAANSMAASLLPADPTSDAFWPTAISPYVPGPTG
jgi:hypothetical protein